MNLDSVRDYCLSFPRAKETLQWGETVCFKVAGKIFAMLSLASIPPNLCVKCAPEKFAELCEQEGVRPAPYVGRFKWVLLERLDVLGDEEMGDLIRQSYAMVAAKSKAKVNGMGKAKKVKVKKVKVKKVKVKSLNHKGDRGHEGKSAGS
jgi:predicted DNA-binding protein (MmcQ/YjbR family)